MQVFKGVPINRFIIGEGTESVKNVADSPLLLNSIGVASNNPYLISDEAAIFSKDVQMLLQLIVDLNHYAVPETVEVIGLGALLISTS